MRALIVLALGCSGASGKRAVDNRGEPSTLAAAEVVDASPPTECERYDAQFALFRACTSVPQAVRDDFEQRNTDLGASISENGLDGAFIDPEQKCDEARTDLEAAAPACFPPR